tara:strand:+ start:127807 stop:128754 length:948 start_codon:yes stop_codon:yes gene_type:complete
LLSAKETYRQFCDTSSRPLIFQTPLWLDAVAGDENWNVILSFKGTLLVGAMPYVTNSKLGLKQITLPFLTPYLGPIIIYPTDLKKDNYHSHDRKVTSDLVAQIPKTDRFITQTDFEYMYWSPFAWAGYSQTTRYSYLLDTSKTEEELLKGFKPNIKKHIRNSGATYAVIAANEIDPVFNLHQNDLKNKGIELLFTQNQFARLDQTVSTSGKRIILHAIDDSGNIVCAFYLVFDHQYMHYLVGAVTDDARNSGVMSLLMWEAIKESKKRGLTFNFEGSMNKNIDRFFSSFGGTLSPYMQISKTGNKWLKQFTRFNH